MTDEQVAMKGLNILGYHFKWKRAKELALDLKPRQDGVHLLPYWERVRAIFLELGGGHAKP